MADWPNQHGEHGVFLSDQGIVFVYVPGTRTRGTWRNTFTGSVYTEEEFARIREGSEMRPLAFADEVHLPPNAVDIVAALLRAMSGEAYRDVGFARRAEEIVDALNGGVRFPFVNPHVLPDLWPPPPDDMDGGEAPAGPTVDERIERLENSFARLRAELTVLGFNLGDDPW